MVIYSKKICIGWDEKGPRKFGLSSFLIHYKVDYISWYDYSKPITQTQKIYR